MSGYTATPYANIFIHRDERHPLYGEDLFPKDFVISLPQPDNYIGPEKIFGMSGDESTALSRLPNIHSSEWLKIMGFDTAFTQEGSHY